MATTTPNYGWDVPTSTDYVKDGASAIETLGDDIDATLYGLVGANTKVGMQLLSTTTLSGASTTISSISQNYADLEIWIYGMTNATTSGYFRCAPNGSTSIVHGSGVYNSAGASAFAPLNNDYFITTQFILNTGGLNAIKLKIENYANASFYKSFNATANYLNSSSQSNSEIFGGGIKTASAITSLVFSNTGGSFNGGTVKVWGCN
jgi:hypothetical protein